MFLAIDIGNSATKIGVYDGQSWSTVDRVAATEASLIDHLSMRLRSVDIDAAGIASVVPTRTDETAIAVREHLGVEPTIISAKLPLPFEMGYETPQTLGADRMAAAAAAWLMFGLNKNRGVIVVDAGTAVTTEVITSDGVYLGGAIAPGPDLLLGALVRDTAQLPVIDWPDSPAAIGSSTHDAISAGASIMFLSGVKALLDRSAKQLNDVPLIVATGGWATWLDHHVDTIDQIEPDLVLDGIRLLAN